MYAIELESKIKDGVIEVPLEHRERLRRESAGDVVRVIVLAGEAVEKRDAASRPDILAELLRNPIRVKDFRPLDRDQLHERP